MTNAQGNFAGYPVRGFQLKGLNSSPCQIAANYVDLQQEIVCTQCALYNIIPRNTSVPAKFRLISGHVKASPQRVHAGLVERISVTDSWGGAEATAYVRYPREPKSHKFTSFHLDWEGRGTRELRIDQSAAQQPGVANVSVAFTLGGRHGSAATSFTVVR